MIEPLANPYLPPTDAGEALNPNPASFATRTSFAIGFTGCALLSFLGFAAHLACGIPVFSAILENQVWVLLLSSLAAISFTFATSRLADAGKFTCAMAGFSILAYHLLEVYIAYWTGTNVERFAFYQRALGNYYWLYWAIVFVLAVLPLASLVSIIRRSSLVSIFSLCLIMTVSGFYLRSNFIVRYGDSMPTSWHQFFWPF